MVSVLRTEGFHGYAVEFSPYVKNRIAATVCQEFGISGSARLLVADVIPEASQFNVIGSCDWTDALFDVTWSEAKQDVIVTAAGDGSVVVWDLSVAQKPVIVWKEHTKEVYGVDWSNTRDIQLVLSASWDKTIKLWDIQNASGSLSTFQGHDHVVYSAIWSPLVSGCFSSVSGDGTLRVWDMRKPHMAQIVVPASSNAEILACDWCKYDQNILATGSTDGVVRVWDLRNLRNSVRNLPGHRYAVRRVKFSPFTAELIISASYDFTVRVWNWSAGQEPLELLEHHSEFVYGLDCSTHIPGQVADCSWDQTIKVYTLASLQTTAQR